MKVSIILLAHNEEKNIAYEIDSIKDKILNKLNEYEFIISEDGSTDKTREIILRKKKEVDLIYFTSGNYFCLFGSVQSSRTNQIRHDYCLGFIFAYFWYFRDKFFP